MMGILYAWSVLYFVELRLPIFNSGAYVNIMYMIFAAGQWYLYNKWFHAIAYVWWWDIFRWDIVTNGCNQAVRFTITDCRVLKI